MALARRPEGLDEIRALGFTGLLGAADILRGALGGLDAAEDGFDLEMIAHLVRAARDHGLDIYLDAALTELPTHHPLVQAYPQAFAIRPGAPNAAPIDPRASQPATGLARVRRDAAEGLGAWMQWATDGLTSICGAGVRGLHLLEPQGLPGRTWKRLLDGAPGLTVIAAPLSERSAAGELVTAGVDYLTSSLAWWDGRAPWLVEEYEALRAYAPLVADVSALDGSKARQALRLAPAVASGLIARLATGEGLAVEAEALRLANRQMEDLAEYDGELRSFTSAGAPVTVLARASCPDFRSAASVLLALSNDGDAPAEVRTQDVLGAAATPLSGFKRLQGSGDAFAPLEPGEVRLLKAARAKPIVFRASPGKVAARSAADAPRIAIEALSPSVDGGRFAVKRTAGEAVVVEADIFADGHELLAAELVWRTIDGEEWRACPMTSLGNDRWRAAFVPDRIGRYLFAVEAWLDVFGGFRRDFAKKLDAKVAQAIDVSEGMRLLERARDRSEGGLRLALAEVLADIEAADADARADLLLSADLQGLMSRTDPRPFRVRSEPQPLDAERLGARFASWYELFPRSITDSPERHGTFDDVIARLPAVKAMGFDVLYFPPIHPIGRKNRKGRNNSLTAGPDDPGSPYAIGSEEGGHDAVHPELGGIEAFDRLVLAARDHGLEIALDFAVQCAPDHPWLKQHPGWFDYRPDGSIKYAENPPKKYEDIVNVDFYKPDAVPSLWIALRDAVMFWVEHGVRLFRVDNPHTKPLPFWEWLIGDVRGRYPDAVFLAEAFTRPKVMYRLAKIGFSQSYTYFTWRNSKAELAEYLTELTTTAPKEFFRPHFFVNTPDINPYFLQTSGRAGFLIRAALAATLSGLFGVYAGFELLEAEPVPGKEEYKDSDKYEIKPRDWNRPSNIIAEISQLNAIRKANPGLQTHLGVRFYNAFNDNVLYYGKPNLAPGQTGLSDMVLVAVSFDPHNAQSFGFEAPLWEWGLPGDGALAVEDLVHGGRFTWRGKAQSATLTPDQPYAIWRVQAAAQA